MNNEDLVNEDLDYLWFTKWIDDNLKLMKI